MIINTYLWQSDSDDLHPLHEKALSSLPQAEQQRAAKFRHRGSRQMYLAGRLLLRRLLAERLDLPAREVPLVIGAKGKPQLAAGREPVCHFNLAHSQGCLIVAICDQGPVGVDLEHCRALDHMDEMAQRVMHPEEYRVYSRQVEGARQEYFFRIWVAKEAFVKWCGAGIGYGLESIHIEPPSQQILLPTDQARLQYLGAPQGFLAALAYSHALSSAVVREHVVRSLFD